MSAADLVIKNGRVATSSSIRSRAIAAKEGKVTWLGPSSNAPRADRVIDASGLVVLPGVIDVHVHMRDPGAAFKEDWRTGTAAAAAGGVTTVFDMPNNTPPTEDLTTFASKVDAAEAKALVDFALYGLLAEANEEELVPLARAGAVGFKCYMAGTTGATGPPPDSVLLRELKLASRTGRRVSFHAEDGALVDRLTSELRAAGRVDALAHYESRPEAAEVGAVRRAISLSKEAGCDAHIAHLSSAPGADEVRRAKRSRRGALTAETCPQYLLLDKEDYPAKGSLMKCNPSIKRREDRLALWKAVRDGTVDMIATDHAPHTLEEKTAGTSIFDRPSGFPGLETSVGLMLTCVGRGLLSLQRYVQLTSERPAKAWGLYPKKGRVARGSDADFTIVDPKQRWTVDPSRFLSKAKYSPFEGFKATGAPVYTVVRGEVVMDHGHVDLAHRGEMQRPS